MAVEVAISTAATSAARRAHWTVSGADKLSGLRNSVRQSARHGSPTGFGGSCRLAFHSGSRAGSSPRKGRRECRAGPSTATTNGRVVPHLVVAVPHACCGISVPSRHSNPRSSAYPTSAVANFTKPFLGIGFAAIGKCLYPMLETMQSEESQLLRSLTRASSGGFLH